MQKSKSSQGLAILLTLAMMVSTLILPASAASACWITAVKDGREVYHESYPPGASVRPVVLVEDLGVGTDVEVSVDGFRETATTRPIRLSGVLANGTVFNIAEDSSRSLSLTTTNSNIMDDISVAIVTIPKAFTISANSGEYGFKSNLGSDSNPTCMASAVNQKVDGNAPWSVTFTPKMSGQAITHLNIRASAASQNIVPVDAGTVAVAGNAVSVSRSGDSVTVSSSYAASDLFVTALTAAKTEQFRLTVTATGDVLSSVSTMMLNAGAAQEITLTPGTGGLVDSISIRDGGKEGLITLKETTATVNGHRYKVNRLTNGQVTLSVPAITSDVTIFVNASTEKAVMTIDAGRGVGLNHDRESYFSKGESVTLRVTPGDDMEITRIIIESETDTVTLDGNDYRFFLDGRAYRVDTRYDSSRVIYFDAFPGSLRIHVDTRNTYHTVTLKSDKFCKVVGNNASVRVADTDSTSFSFTADDTVSIEELVFSYGGKTYRVNNDESSIRIDGTRCPISWENSSRKVTVTLYSVSQDITVRAVTNAEGEDSHVEYNGKFIIHIDSDRGASNPEYFFADEGGNQLVSFKNRSGYVVEKLIITVGTEVYSVKRGTSTIRIGGEKCSVNWGTNQTTIELADIHDDISIFAETSFSTSIGTYMVTLNGDPGIEIVSDSRVYISDDEEVTVAFSGRDGSSIDGMVIVYAGKAYTAVRNDDYVLVDGMRFPIRWRSNGEVRLTLKGISKGIVVYANSDFDDWSESGSHTITKRPDSNSTITLSTKTSNVKLSQDVTVTVTPKQGYSLDEVELRLGATIRTIHHTTDSFTYAGRQYDVTHSAKDGSLSIYFQKLPADLTVTSTTKAQGGESQENTSNGNGMAGLPPSMSGTYHMAYIQGFSDGTFGPYQTTSRAQALAMLTRAVFGSEEMLVTNTTTPYVDVEASAWYAPYVVYAYNQGILPGLNHIGSHFRPNDPITRAEYTEFVCRFMGIAPTGDYGAQFPDVAPEHWAYSTVSYAASRGWVRGFGDGLFRPDQTITRAQMVALTNRVLNRSADAAFIQAYGTALNRFSDVAVSFWAYYDIMEASHAHNCISVSGRESWQTDGLD